MAATPQLKHTWATVVKDEFGTAQLTDTQIILGSNKFVENILVPAGTTAEIDCGSIDRTKITSLFVVSTQAVTVNTNASNGTGGQIVALAANKAWAWNENMPTSIPVTANITKIFCVNDALVDATFKVDILSDLII